MTENLCICIPTYNERENLPILVEKINEISNSNTRIIVVDDNSPDGTGTVADELAHKYAITVIHREKKTGLGSAYKDAFAHALTFPTIKIIVEMDADLSHDPVVMPTLIAPIMNGTADVVVASREVLGGEVLGWGVRRKLAHFTANLLVKIMLPIGVNDATSGYRAFSRNALEKIGFEDCENSGFAFQVETLFRAKNADLRICEVPFTFKEREHGKSKFSIREITGFIMTLFRLTMH